MATGLRLGYLFMNLATSQQMRSSCFTTGIAPEKRMKM